MAHELDLDDAVANVSGDVARRELEELRAELTRLDRICNEQITSIDALDRECHRLKEHLQQVLDDANWLGHVDPETLNNIEVEINHG